MSAPLSICPGLVEQRMSYLLGRDYPIPFNLIPGKKGVIDSFELGETPITNRQWRAYFSRYHTSTYILMAAIPRPNQSGELDFYLVRRSSRVENLLGEGLANTLGEWGWDEGRTPALFSLPQEGIWGLFGNRTQQERVRVGDLTGIQRIANNQRDPLVNGALIVFRLHKVSPWPRFNGLDQPVVGLSCFHMKLFCRDLGLELPTDEEWTWAAIGGEANLEYPTFNNQLVDSEGRPLTHWNQDVETGSTCSVFDKRYPPGPFGLRQMAGNVCERTKRDMRETFPYRLRGGSWVIRNDAFLRGRCRDFSNPGFWNEHVSFRLVRRRGL